MADKQRLLLASLDTFWLPQLQKSLEPTFSTKLVTTWSLKRPSPNQQLVCRNLWPFHYFLQSYKMFPSLHFNNHTYAALVSAFDAYLCQFTQTQKWDAYIPLSGVALWSGRKFHRAGKPVILECGSTHTDHQNQVLVQENKRNGINSPLFPQSYRDRIRQEFIEADFINVPSHFVAKTFLENGIPESKIKINPYGSDTSNFKPRTEDDFDRPFRLICPSGVNLRKGARILVEAWRKLEWHDAELHWIGSPRSDTKHLFNPMPKGITWHSWMTQEKLAELYASCDALVLPSFEEGFARVLVEAAASGLLLIATPETGVEDFFTPDYPEGFLIPSNNVDALCSILESAKANRQQTRTLGLRAAERVRKGFSIEDYGERACGNFNEILCC